MYHSLELNLTDVKASRKTITLAAKARHENECLSAEWSRGPVDKGHGKERHTKCLVWSSLLRIPKGRAMSLRAM